MMNFVYYKQLKINVITFFRETILKQVISLLVSGFISTLVLALIPNYGWLGLGLRGAIIIVVYLISSYSLFLNSEEKLIVRKTIKY